MSKVQMLRALVKQRLTAAAEEIFGLFERTIAEYEEELCRSKEENHRQRHLLDAVFNPDVHLQTADAPQLFLGKNVAPEHLEQSSSLDQDDPHPPHIKEEQEELWSSREGEQLQALDETVPDFPLVSAPMKIEDTPQSSQFHQRHIEGDREVKSQASSSAEDIKRKSGGQDHGGPGPDTSFDPEMEDSHDWMEAREPQSSSVCLKYKMPANDGRRNPGGKPYSCSECGKRFRMKSSLMSHMPCHTGEKPFSCSICRKCFGYRSTMALHMKSHKEEKPFSCSVCGKLFNQKCNLKRHMAIHIEEKPFSCPVCCNRFRQKAHLKTHMTSHTGEKPCSCSFCNKTFRDKSTLRIHMTVHTGEKLFKCSACGKGFNIKQRLVKHKCVKSL
ncbi:zinc finger protein 37 homolog [Thalassophryne amazonica]|uniref:zinc finger protein 37 homolog n=1 Tax=Thalassophryne amazonica TaxID=390379 RepID=UPI00147156FF|nr:zinc finger protein 37 homolog [Thalassophryne amazonica]